MKHLLLTAIAAVLLVGIVLAGPIHDAAWGGDLDSVQAELDKGVDVDTKDDNGFTPLHITAGWGGQKDMAELLIAKGADVNAKSNGGETPLHYATSGDNREIADLLIAEGADVNAMEEWGQTPLHWAAVVGHKEIAELLIANGADLNAKEEDYKQTPLSYAIVGSNKEIVELLIANGADVNAKGVAQVTALHWAVANVQIGITNEKEIVELLIVKGADVNAQDEDGGTPLDWAEEASENEPPEDKADKKEIAELLRRHGGKTGEELWLMPRLVQHGQFAFSFDAKEGITYEVQDSLNLTNWEVIKTYTGTGKTVRFDEERDHDPPQWFYRVRVVE